MLVTRFVCRSKRVLLLTCGLAAAAHFAIEGAIPADGDWPEVKVIDMHTHVFNARDLPLRGILEARGAPVPVSVILEIIFSDSMKQGPSPNLMQEVEQPTVRPLSDQERKTLRDYVGKNPEELKALATDLGVSDDVILIAETLRKADFPPDKHDQETPEPEEQAEATPARHGSPPSRQRRHQPSRTPRKKKRGLTYPGSGYVRFIGIMLQQHEEIVADLQQTYPADLFVHHMMDLKMAYNDDPKLPFEDQIKEMQSLDQKFPGKLLHFVAFDPFRRQAALPLVQTGVKDFGAVGLKIYPPSGYQAAKNATSKFPPPKPSANAGDMARWRSRYHGWTEQQLDDTLQSAFVWAAHTLNGVPLFSHCARGGFEAEKGYGRMADPDYWAAALEKKENAGLRLCFGHAGGDAYWFSDPANDRTNQSDPAWQFGNKVVKLCRKYPNVYADVGYFSEILKRGKREVLLKRLRNVMNLKTEYDDKQCFGDKLMYGSDWDMLIKEAHYTDYTNQWDKLIKQVDSGKWRAAFFAGNAKKFLQLDALAQDQRFTQDQRDELGKLSRAIK